MLRSISLIAMAMLYVAAGVNHFRTPTTYVHIIPDYFPAKNTLNILAGVAEIVLGILFFPKATRYFAAIGIIAMLIAFLPVHVWMLQKGEAYYKVSDWLLWARLLVGQPLLIWWAWSNRF